ncbi:protein FAR1-RELATED SEQUENCE 1-like [Citrus sinensis]|uniref:protein FAR1-RELATED SEQUENCE 1-like n=1 Tax=Citrus sinensis TaxID=2711 RepID=UPI002278944C|nr:protein FAR1-RELATED SEQUENCE 1-like [Citrus sinensis]
MDNFEQVEEVDEVGELQNLQGVDLEENNEELVVENVVEPTVGMSFDSPDEMFEYYKTYGQQLPCRTSFAMEKQVEEVYTISKFQEFQQELMNKIYYEVFSCGGSKYEVIENDEKSRENIFKVIFEKDEGEIRYVCSMFEYKGILCKHAIAMLSRNRVQLLFEKYILRRWRKEVRRFYSKVKVSYDARSSSIEHQRYKEECTAFYDVAEVASKNEESHKNIMGWIEKVMKDVSLNVRCDGDDTTIDGGPSSNIQDLVVTRRKGRPPSQRKQK